MEFNSTESVEESQLLNAVFIMQDLYPSQIKTNKLKNVFKDQPVIEDFFGWQKSPFTLQLSKMSHALWEMTHHSCLFQLVAFLEKQHYSRQI